MKNVFVLFLAGLVILVAGLSYADPQHYGGYGTTGMMGYGGMMGGMMGSGHMMGSYGYGRYGMGSGNCLADNLLSYQSDLGLSMEQQEKLRSIASDYRVKVADKRNKIVNVQNQLSDLYNDPDTQYSKIAEKSRERDRLMQEMRDLQYQHASETEKILTPDQLQKARRTRGCGYGMGW